ncbi:MAG: hypothetical protein AAFY25_05240 [Pseudomonadota bacterium]
MINTVQSELDRRWATIDRSAMLDAICVAVALVFALALNGAIPGWSLSTLGQSIVIVGYPIDFLNSGFGTLKASSFGLPTSTPMSTLLAPSIVMQLPLVLGLHPADAFSVTLALWSGLGFYGAYAFSRSAGLGARTSALTALMWFAFPIVWNSANYSHLHFGFVILPFLVHIALSVSRPPKGRRHEAFARCLTYGAAAQIAVFTDGYAFMVFAASATLIGAAQVALGTVQERHRAFVFLLPLHIAAFASAYVLYTAYVGVSGFSASSMDFFRAWGADLTFLFAPSRGTHWIWDTLGLSVARTQQDFFGDASVWTSTFILPLILLFAWLTWQRRIVDSHIAAFSAMTVAGIFLALGPSLKVNSQKPEGFGPLMPAEYAVTPTGSALLYTHMPGLKNTRATYRWMALAYLGLWGGVVFLLARTPKEDRKAAVAATTCATLAFMPNLPVHFGQKQAIRDQFVSFDRDLAFLESQVGNAQRALFLPHGNDFVASYLAPRLGFRTFNVGGDKNYDLARAAWPLDVARAQLSASEIQRYRDMLNSGLVDAIVLPKFDMLWGAHAWPSPPINTHEIAAITSVFENEETFRVTDLTHAATIRLKTPLDDLPPLDGMNVADSLDVEVSPAVGFQSQSGLFTDAGLIADQATGYILFGPYLPLRAGTYQVTLYGSVSLAGELVFDVTTDYGAQTHAQYIVSATVQGSNSEPFVSVEIVIDQDVSGLEVRLRSDGESTVTVDRVLIEPI